MSRPSAVTEITSLTQLRDLLSSSKGTILGIFSNSSTGQRFNDLLGQFQNAFKVVHVDISKYPDVGAAYQINEAPRFVLFRNGKAAETFKSTELPALVAKLAGAGSSGGEASGSGGAHGSNWLGAGLPRSYKDVSDQIELKRVELLNVDSDKGSVRVLFSPDKPSALSAGKGKEIDWVESDTDEQLLLFMPFQSMLKLHTLQITSIPPSGDDVDEDENPMRPKIIKLYPNRPHNLGFDQAESTAPTQEIEITESDWNAEGTANIPLRFVKFQNINSLVIFIESGDGSSEKVRLDRLRLIGESGEKREMGKLEKIGDEPGE